MNLYQVTTILIVVLHMGLATVIEIAPVYPGTSTTASSIAKSTTGTTSTTAISPTTTDMGFSPVLVPIQNTTAASNSTGARNFIGPSDLLFDEDIREILQSASTKIGDSDDVESGDVKSASERISNGYDEDEEEEGEDDDAYVAPPEPRPYRRRRPYGMYPPGKLYGSHSEPFIQYANPYSTFVKKRPRPYKHAIIRHKPQIEHYKFYKPPAHGGYRRGHKRYGGYHGLPIGGMYRDAWYYGMHRRPGGRLRDYGYRRHSKPPKFDQWKDHKEGDQEPSDGHVIESYDGHADAPEVIEHKPPPKPGYVKVMGPPPPEILDKINKLYKKPCYLPGCDQYKKGYIKFSYKKIVFPKKVKLIPLKKKKKKRPIVVYEPAPVPVKDYVQPAKDYAPVVAEEYPTHNMDIQIPYGIGGFEYTPSYPTKVVDSYVPDFASEHPMPQPVHAEPYSPTYIPTDYGASSHGMSYDDNKGSYSNPSHAQAAPTSGYDSSNLAQSYPSMSYASEAAYPSTYPSSGSSYGSSYAESSSPYGTGSYPSSDTTYGTGSDSSHGAQGSSYGAQGSTYGAPSSSYGEQGSTYGAPSSSYGTPGSSYGAQGSQGSPHGAQGSTYGAQSPSYGAQGSSYGAQGSSYGAQGSSYGAQGSPYGAQSSSYGAQGSSYGAQGSAHGAQGSSDGTAPGPSYSYDNKGVTSYSGTYGTNTDYGSASYGKSNGADQYSPKQTQGNKVYFKQTKTAVGQSNSSPYTKSASQGNYILKTGGASPVGTGYVKELESRPRPNYGEKKVNVLKGYYNDEAKYDKGPPKDPYGPTYMPEHDLSASFPYERSDTKVKYTTNPKKTI